MFLCGEPIPFVSHKRRCGKFNGAWTNNALVVFLISFLIWDREGVQFQTPLSPNPSTLEFTPPDRGNRENEAGRTGADG